MTQDPERDATAPTGWHFWIGRSKSDIDQLAQNAGERVINELLRFQASNGVRITDLKGYVKNGHGRYTVTSQSPKTNASSVK